MDIVGVGVVLLYYELFWEIVSFGGNSLGWFVFLIEDVVLNESVLCSIDDMFVNFLVEMEILIEVVFN